MWAWNVLQQCGNYSPSSWPLLQLPYPIRGRQPSRTRLSSRSFSVCKLVSHLKFRVSWSPEWILESGMILGIFFLIGLDDLPMPDTDTLMDLRNFTFTHNPKDVCKDSNLYFLFLVHSKPDNEELRRIIRDNWGSVRGIDNSVIRVVFLLGQPRHEILTHPIKVRTFFSFLNRLNNKQSSQVPRLE